MGSEQKRLMLALVLSGLVIFGWQAFFVSQVEVEPTPSHEVGVNGEIPDAVLADMDEPSTSSHSKPQDLSQQEEPAVELKSLKLSKDGHEFSLLNNLTIENIINPTSVFDFQSIAGGDFPFQIQLLTDRGAEDLYFDLAIKNGGDYIEGEDARYGVQVVAKILDNGKLDFALSSDRPYRYRFIFDSWAEDEDNGKTREFIYHTTDVDRIEVGRSEQSEASINWFGLDYNYHLFAFILNERSPVLYESTSDGRFVIDFVRPTEKFVGDLVFTRKNYDTLVGLGNQLHLAVDFGFIGVIAVPMLKSLQWFYSFFPNYGVAIILLTLVIRTILFPLSYTSFKSMKKMQKLQPELTKLKEKYKDDPQKMQKETMELFKKSGANPLGGCLPLLLQMPIFFAFYRVLYSSVELVNAPFILWISDLSVKDPYYVLPVIMAATMFGQQKLMPSTTMDPTQRKIMLFLPLIFGFIMKDFPAGLNLYIAVSTLFGIIQQMAVYRMTD